MILRIESAVLKPLVDKRVTLPKLGASGPRNNGVTIVRIHLVGVRNWCGELVLFFKRPVQRLDVSNKAGTKHLLAKENRL